VKKQVLKCNLCGSTKNITVERRLDGYCHCHGCGNYWKNNSSIDETSRVKMFLNRIMLLWTEMPELTFMELIAYIQKNLDQKLDIIKDEDVIQFIIKTINELNSEN